MNRPDLCLEFANTRYWRGQPTPTETLNSAEDLTAWAAGNVSKDARPLARREFERAIDARETIYRVFDATARGKVPAASDLQALNDLLVTSPSRTTLKRERSGFAWDVEMRSSTEDLKRWNGASQAAPGRKLALEVRATPTNAKPRPKANGKKRTT